MFVIGGLTMKTIKLYYESNEYKKYLCAEQKTLMKTPMHWHDYFELEICLSGKGVTCINGKNYEYEAGSVFFITPTDVHSYSPSEPTEFLHISFNNDCLDYYNISDISYPVYVIIAKPKNYDYSLLVYCLKSIIYEYDNDSPYKKAMIKHFISLLLFELAKLSDKTQEITNENVSSGIKKAMAYIQLHFRENITLNEVAECTGKSTEHTSRLFSQSLGISFKKYLTKIRLNYSKSLLRHTNETISDIAYYSGFNSASQYSRVFLKEYSISPNEYRKTHIDN